MLIASELKEQSPNKLDSRFRGNDSGCGGNGKLTNDIEKLSWKDSVAVQKVLDSLCQILAEEYCRIAKENPEIFTTEG